MRIMLLGAPGAGKGTQAGFLSHVLDIPKISTGDILRTAVSENSHLGKQAKTFMNAGELVPDELILDLIKKKMFEANYQKGFLLDGFPRTVLQAESLWQIKFDLDYIIEIQVSDSEVLRRLTGRRVHLISGCIYHTEFNPPKYYDLDNKTNEPLTQREDDKEEIVIQRLYVYHKRTKPLIGWYHGLHYQGMAQYIHIPGECSINIIRRQLVKQLLGAKSKQLARQYHEVTFISHILMAKIDIRKHIDTLIKCSFKLTD